MCKGYCINYVGSTLIPNNVYRETLYHFKVKCCNKWFSVGDFHEIYQDYMFCPYCGAELYIKEREDVE